MYCWQNVGKMLARLPTLRQRCQLMANVGPTMNVCWEVQPTAPNPSHEQFLLRCVDHEAH